jgi:hypothetical protein
VQNLLAEAILDGRISAGQTAWIDVHEGLFMAQPRPTAAESVAG